MVLFVLLALNATPWGRLLICSSWSPVSASSLMFVLQTLTERARNDMSTSIFPLPSV